MATACLEKPPVVDAPKDDRLALRRTHVKRQATADEVNSCTASVKRGEELLALAENDLRVIKEMENATAQRHAKEIAAGKVPQPDDELRRARVRAEQHYADRAASLRILKGELQAAEAEHERSERKVNEAIESIVKTRAAAEAAELASLWADVWRRYDRLSVFAEQRFAQFLHVLLIKLPLDLGMREWPICECCRSFCGRKGRP
jgi:hypothetical protein